MQLDLADNPAPQLHCPRIGHHERPLNRVCLHRECFRRNLICEQCQKNIHNQHTVKSFNQFLLEAQERRNDQKMQDIVEETVILLKDSKEKCMALIFETKDRINADLDHLMQKVETYFEDAEAINRQVGIYQDIVARPYDCRSGQTSNAIIKETRKELSLYFEIGDAREAILKDIQNHIQLQKQIVSTQTSLLQQFFSNSTSLLQKSASLLKPPQFQSTPLLTSILAPHTMPISKWSPTLHHKDLNITSHMVSRNKQTTKGWHVGVLADAAMPLHPHTIYEWSIRICSKKSEMIGIGICLESVVKKLNFKMGYWLSTGHGNYVVSSDGKTFSHSDGSVNSKEKGFAFGEGDVLEFAYEPAAKELSIVKNFLERLEFKIQAPPQGDSYHPCAYLLDVGDVIEFVEQTSTTSV